MVVDELDRSMPQRRDGLHPFGRLLPDKSTLLGVMVAGAAAIVLAGWEFNVPRLTNATPGYVTMKANTAVAFVLVGMSLVVSGLAGDKRRSRQLALVCAGATALLGLLTLCEYLLSLDLGIDQLFVHVPPAPAGVFAPGRMGPASALNFVLLGGALACSARRRTVSYAQRLVPLVALIAMVPFLGYLYGAPALYGLGRYTQMSLQSAILFMLASLGVYLLHPGDGLMLTITPDSMGAWLMRRMTPFVVGVPLVLGWLRVQGEKHGYFDGPLGVAIVMSVIMFLMTVLVWWTARTLTRLDAKRRQSEAQSHEALIALREGEAQMRAITTVAQNAILMITPEGRISYWNPAAERIFGYTPSEALGQVLHELIVPARFRQAHHAAFGQFCRTGQGAAVGKTLELQGRCKDGREIAVELSLSAVQLRGQWHAVGILRDVTEKKQRDAKLGQLSQVVEQTPASVVITDTAGAIEYVNPAFTQTTGYTAAEVIGRSTSLLKSGLTPPETYAAMWSELLAGREWRGELQNRDKNGEMFWELAVISPLRGCDGKTTHYVAVKENITARKVMEEELRTAARTDKLTGLPNRTLFCDRLEQAILRSRRLKDYRFAVLFLDFDRFKIVNDSLGHNVGDLLLQQIGQRLRSSLRAGDSLCHQDSHHTTARFGGDEFVVLLDGLSGPQDAAAVAERLLQVLATPYRLGEHDVHSTASIGIVTNDVAADSAEQILRDADTAMYEAKLAGRGQHVVFSARMRQRVLERVSMENDLRKALELDQFFLVYEPIVSLVTGRIERFEALLRWRHPQRGIVSPGEFIPIAEDTGLILPIGQWVLREACGKFANWRKTLGDSAPPSVGVNLSRTQLLLRNLPDTISKILDQTGLPASLLHLEVTESAVMKDVATAIGVLNAIKAIGIKLDMDDFGTGYSSLACLHQFPIDVLKIDRSFIANIERGRDFMALVQVVAQLARNLNIQIVAEGVETTDQALILQSLDCEFAQGYLFGKGRPAEELAQFKSEMRVWPTAAAAAPAVAAVGKPANPEIRAA